MNTWFQSIFFACTSRLTDCFTVVGGRVLDAPSWCYLAGSPCRNITCLNKMFKTSGTIRCFEHVDLEGLSTIVVSHFLGLARLAPE
jgi:hypothetical protein